MGFWSDSLHKTLRACDDRDSQRAAAISNIGGFRSRVGVDFLKRFGASMTYFRRASALPNFGSFRFRVAVELVTLLGPAMIVVLGGLWLSQTSTVFDFVLRTFSEGCGRLKHQRLSISRCGRLRKTFRGFDDRGSRRAEAISNFSGFRSRVAVELVKLFGPAKLRQFSILRWGRLREALAWMLVVLGDLRHSKTSDALDFPFGVDFIKMFSAFARCSRRPYGLPKSGILDLL
ncbi:hypothetical protein NPIL_322461 [Nephila pilipes]|uniref:Uncharacterized protein n=1 Tax=Nephila pilipes TaxID=299642 RepID=A0A8X6IP05_NEPPI|nr:hypothetical protein NPIL_322461 [Nephila pilipes]